MVKLVKCKACGTEISSGAKACPKCGDKKKGFLDGCGTLIVIVLVLMVVVWFFSGVFFGT